MFQTDEELLGKPDSRKEDNLSAYEAACPPRYLS